MLQPATNDSTVAARIAARVFHLVSFSGSVDVGSRVELRSPEQCLHSLCQRVFGCGINHLRIRGRHRSEPVTGAACSGYIVVGSAALQASFSPTTRLSARDMNEPRPKRRTPACPRRHAGAEREVRVSSSLMQNARAGTVRRTALVVSCRFRRSPQGPRAPHVPHRLAACRVARVSPEVALGGRRRSPKRGPSPAARVAAPRTIA